MKILKHQFDSNFNLQVVIDYLNVYHLNSL